jgi:hypothetical protein
VIGLGGEGGKVGFAKNDAEASALIGDADGRGHQPLLDEGEEHPNATNPRVDICNQVMSGSWRT